MIRNVFHKAQLVVALVCIVVFAVITAYLCVEFNVKAGLIIGSILFLSLGGIELIWFLLRYSARKRDNRTIDQIESDAFNKATKNNPTLR